MVGVRGWGDGVGAETSIQHSDKWADEYVMDSDAATPTSVARTGALAGAPIKVLHIAESYSSGVASAIDAYLDAQPEGIDAVVCGYRIPGVQLGERVELDVPFHELPLGKLAQLFAVRRAVVEHKPDVVHVHSSWAGLFGRIVPMPRGTRVVFTPHCYGFQRLDLPKFMRLSFLIVDIVLGWRTDVVLACSLHEADISRRYRLGKRVLHLPQELPEHISAALRQVKPASRVERSPIVVGMTGRISPQKDPGFFAAVARGLRTTAAGRDGFVFKWIGGGPEGSADELEAAGVQVTGWMAQEASVKELAGCDVYLHTAAWEGYPMTVIEARELGLPIIARSIPALVAEADGIRLVDDPAQAVRALLDLAEDGPEEYAPSVPTSIEFRRQIMADAYGLSPRTPGS